MNSGGHVIVTGGAGFIGSHLVERLLRDGETVVVVDDFSTGHRGNLALLATPSSRLRVIESTVSGCDELNDLVAGAKGVFHLAAVVGVEQVLKSPVHTLRANLHETEAILAAASAHRVPLLLASSSEVYGRSEKPEFDEEDDLVIGPPRVGRWSYACSKLMDEFLALGCARERGLPVVIARLFNTVGPRQSGRYGMVLPRFIAAARAGHPLRVFGDGRQTRCFCLVQDTIEALIRLHGCDAARGEVFNVGSAEEISILGLAELVVSMLGSKSRIELVPYATAYGPGFDEMRRRRPALQKLERITGFRSVTSLQQTVATTAAWLPPDEDDQSGS